MKESPYITWAKHHHQARYNLAGSGVTPLPIEQLGVQPEDLDLSGEHEEGWPPLLERIAGRYGVEPSNVVLAPGCSMANHIVCSLLLEPGDTVLVEHPVYEPLQLLPRLFHAEVRFFERRPEDDYRLNPETIEPLLDDRTRLLICSNLHNPTGKLARRADLEVVASLAETHGFHALVDEVYLEWLHDEGESTATLLGPRLITTRSLTKAYGLNALRAGWVIAEEEVAERLRRLNDLFAIIMPLPIERMAARAFDRAQELLSPLKKQLDENQAIVEDFIANQPLLSWTPPAAGPIGFVRLKDGSAEELVVRLREHDTAVAPGRFFGVADHFRLGFGVEKEILVEGLRRLDSVTGQVSPR
jgi:aspartate/methionine/tyrosine aminotransferase